VFRYVGDGEGAAEEGATVLAPPSVELAPPPAPLAPPPPVVTGPRLIGLMRQGGTLRAALSVDGEMLVVAAGERAGAYTVVSVDEDAVTLRDAAGTTLTLSPPEG
jgi:hypothetical protein